MGPPTDGELLRRAAARDRDAFSQLYVRHEAIVAMGATWYDAAGREIDH